jgi:5,10-methylenetetrahydrofolate reductase
MKNRFLDALADRVLLCDSGMGTVLYGKGVYLNTCFDELNLTNPAIVKEVHREYVQCGVDIIETNTFGANRLKLRKYGLNDKVGDINRSGAAIARDEAGEAVFDVDSIGLANVVSGLNQGVDIGGKAMAKPTSFLIGVGVNPGAINLDSEIVRFERKIEAGAEFAITQPVFDIRALESFLEKTARFRVPILGGIWPLWSLANAEFMHNEVPGASVPSDVMERMRRAQDKGPEFARGEGVAIAREVVCAIKGMVQGVQVSPPLGKYELVLEVLEGL